MNSPELLALERAARYSSTSRTARAAHPYTGPIYVDCTLAGSVRASPATVSGVLDAETSPTSRRAVSPFGKRAQPAACRLERLASAGFMRAVDVRGGARRTLGYLAAQYAAHMAPVRLCFMPPPQPAASQQRMQDCASSTPSGDDRVKRTTDLERLRDLTGSR